MLQTQSTDVRKVVRRTWHWVIGNVCQYTVLENMVVHTRSHGSLFLWETFRAFCEHLSQSVCLNLQPTECCTYTVIFFLVLTSWFVLKMGSLQVLMPSGMVKTVPCTTLSHRDISYRYNFVLSLYCLLSNLMYLKAEVFKLLDVKDPQMLSSSCEGPHPKIDKPSI